LHAVAPQAYGAQSVVAAPPGQEPVPSHVDAVVWTPPAHDAPHGVPGTQAPPQLPPSVPTPPTHASAQVVAAPHCPSAPQVATCVSLVHSVAPGAHTPVQTPPTHVWFVQEAPFDCQLPVASQTWGCWPLHLRAVGLQVTHPPLRHTGVVAPEHAGPTSCQPVPTALHCCGCEPLQP
jgi:hypothetical protein